MLQKVDLQSIELGRLNTNTHTKDVRYFSVYLEKNKKKQICCFLFYVHVLYFG